MFIPRFFSYIFHPVFMPLIGLFIILNSGIYSETIPANYSRFLLLIVFICDVLLPLSIIPALIYLKHLDNIYIDEKKQRLIPLFFTTICFYIGYYVIDKFTHSILINYFLLSATVVVLGILLISLFWKISIHMAGIGGLTGLIIILSKSYHIDMVILLCAAILITGTIASSRLALGTHTIFETFAGYIFGLAVILLIML